MSLVLIFFGIILLVLLFQVISGLVQSDSAVPPSRLSDEDIRELARQGKKIEAIKQYRMLHGVGLKQAKNAVEEMMQ
ncbi:MAG: hypothetical protein F6K09_05375 [Merismopedia sp. SIO2A8]|nr:hypothetical protein [Symploca sp. SIO2B6]NET48151.1 hypothetical protein [Merismopedia sp. SIO2A8]